MTLERPAAETRFPFGDNWRRFLAVLDDHRIAESEKALAAILGTGDLHGRSFLDIGSGSGLSSLAARRLGARVTSFDYDPQSVACTTELRRRYFPEDDDASWRILQGSVLDAPFLDSLGTFDVVYSWGVLHHTGDMAAALANAAKLVAPEGLLMVAIYNDQGWRSRVWTVIKRWYNELPPPLRFLILGPALVRLWGPALAFDLVRGHGFRRWREYGGKRGMSAWHDVVDWVGGYPFEVAKPEVVFDFYKKRGFRLERMTTCGGKLGCNEFVFARAHPSDE